MAEGDRHGCSPDPHSFEERQMQESLFRSVSRPENNAGHIVDKTTSKKKKKEKRRATIFYWFFKTGAEL